MDRLSTNRRVFRELSHWYLCVVILLTAQLLFLFLWTLPGPSDNWLERVLEMIYVSPASYMANTLFEGEGGLGNVPFGLGLLLLVVILHAFLGGTVIYLIRKLVSVLRHKEKHEA